MCFLIKKNNNEHELKKVDEISDSLVPFELPEIYLSSIAIFKMIKHSKAGIPVEVMGLLVGEYVGETRRILVKNVFGMPQSGTGISIEAIDPIFQTKMLDMFRQIDILDIIVGWYHSHPGFGCWLSGVDINTQQNFEQLNKNSIAIVIDPIWSTKSKITIEGFKLYHTRVKGQKIYDITSMEILIDNFSISKNGQGLNKYYCSLNIVFKTTVLEYGALFSLYENTRHRKILLPNFFNYFSEKKCSSVYQNIFFLIERFEIECNLFFCRFNPKTSQKMRLVFEKLKKKFNSTIAKLIVSYIKKLLQTGF